MKKISIVIPVFNEELNITILIKEIYIAIKNINIEFEIIIIDDASTDNSNELIKKLLKKKEYNIKLIENLNNRGQSYSLHKAIKHATYDTVVTLDGDGQNNPADIPNLVKLYFADNNLYLVGGIRNKRKDSLVKIFSSRIANRIRKFILKDNCDDTGCSLKIFDKNIFLLFPFFDGIHRFLPALFKGYAKETFFINVDHRKRIYGKSKYGTIKRLFKGIFDIIRVLKIINKFKNND